MIKFDIKMEIGYCLLLEFIGSEVIQSITYQFDGVANE